LNAVAGAAHPLLLLDYDGTLAPFRINRFEARPWAGVWELLQKIQEKGRTRMVVITGRPAREIEPLLGLEPALEVWGLHGAERLFPNGRRELEEIPAETRAKLDEMRARLSKDSLGGLYEDKSNAAVMHWRGLVPHKAKQVEERTRELFVPLAAMEGLSLLEFDAGLELRGGRDKGGAVEAILRAAGAVGSVAFLGDDVTDEPAFKAVNRAAGAHLSVLVKREWRETEADVWLKPPVELLEFLEQWAEVGLRQGKATAN